jgi:integrase
VQSDYWDTKTPGFGVRVGPNSKTFVVKAGNRRTTIGRYPDEISLSDARKKALGVKSEVRAVVRAPTFGQALEQYLTLFVAVNNRPRVQRERRRILRRHFLPKLSHKPLDRVTDRELGDIIYSLLDAPSSANHAFKEARTFLRWCAKPPRRYIPMSPLQGMSMPVKEKRRRRVLTDPELASVWRAAERVGYPYGTILRLLILTGQRRGEIAFLQWPWIDRVGRTITLPGWLTKNGVDHTFPYGAMADEIFDTIPRRNSTALLFPSRDDEDKPYNGWQKAKANLEQCPALRPWTLHDLRRTFSTRLGDLNIPQRINDRLLNHISQGEISPLGQVYNLSTYVPQMREAVAQFEGHLTGVLARH